MNIAIYSGIFLPQINGVVSYVIDTATALVKRGHTVSVFVPKPKRNIKINRSLYPFTVYFLPSLPALIYPSLRVTQPSLFRLTNAMRELSIDIVHLNDPSPLCIEGMMAAKFMKIPVIVTFHTFFFDPDIFKTVRFSSVFQVLKGPLVRLNTYFHNFADTVICPSVSAQKELLESGLTSPTVVIHNGIDVSHVHRLTPKEKTLLRQRYHIATDAPTGIFVGRLAADKRVDVLLRAWVRVISFFPKAILIIVGAGPQEKELRYGAQKLSLTHNVVFTGVVKREDIMEESLYSLGDIYVSASRIENQSMSMTEAMAHGLPIVAVNMHGVSELVDETNGVLTGTGAVSLGKGIVSLLGDKEKGGRLGSTSLKKVRKYDVAETARELEKLYMSVQVMGNPEEEHT